MQVEETKDRTSGDACTVCLDRSASANVDIAEKRRSIFEMSFTLFQYQATACLQKYKPYFYLCTFAL